MEKTLVKEEQPFEATGTDTVELGEWHLALVGGGIGETVL